MISVYVLERTRLIVLNFNLLQETGKLFLLFEFFELIRIYSSGYARVVNFWIGYFQGTSCITFLVLFDLWV